MELPVILQTAVQQVQRFLQVDRLVIYRLDHPRPAWAALGQEQIEQSGSVSYEARAFGSIPSVINFSETHCFVRMVQYQDEQWQDLAIAVQDVETRYDTAPCLFLQQAQVRAKLVTPILVSDRLWGLLIAHQCFEPR